MGNGPHAFVRTPMTIAEAYAYPNVDDWKETIIMRWTHGVFGYAVAFGKAAMSC